MLPLSYNGTDQVSWISLAAGVISQDLVLSELGVFDWLTHVQASPLTYLAVLGACALDAILPIVPSEAVVIAASILATSGELSIWVIALAAAAGGFLGDTGSYVLGRTAGASAARRLFRRPKAKAGSPGPGRPWSGMAPPSSWWPALSPAVGPRPPSPPARCGWLGRGLPLPTRLARPCGRHMRPGWAISAVRRASGVRCMPSRLVWAWPCWSPSRSRRRGGSGGAVPGLAVGARLADSRSNKDGQRRPHRSIVVRYYAATTEYGLSGAVR